MILEIILIFLAGIVVDVLVTRYTSAVAEKKCWSATSLSAIITVANFVLLTFIIKESALSGMYNILAFAGGNSVGTYIAMRRV